MPPEYENRSRQYAGQVKGSRNDQETSLPHVVTDADQRTSNRLLHLQRTIGNRAVLQQIQNRTPSSYRSHVQRALTIGSDRITHASRRVNILYNEVVLPALEGGGYKTYGIKSKLVEYIRSDDRQFDSIDEFLGAFMRWLGTQTRTVKGGNTTPVLKEFDISTVSRPSWPDELKDRLGFTRGDNIRHVIRNATLKRALKIEYDNYHKNGGLKERFLEIANEIGLTLGPSDPIDQIAAQVYRTIYLNEANLFSGSGIYNQVIGFAADRVRAFGEQLLGMGDEPVDAMKVLQTVMDEICRASDSAGWPVPNPVTNDLHMILNNIILQKTDDGKIIDFVDAELLGDLITDAGINFGFDLIDGRVQDDQENIADRQRQLIETEMALQQFIESKGTASDLKAILSGFMSIARGS